MMNIRDKILSCDDSNYMSIHIDEWDVDVLVRGMTGKERDIYEMAIATDVENGRKPMVRAQVVVMVACDLDKKPIFTDSDVVPLSQKSAKPIDLIFSVCMELSKTSKEHLDKLLKK